jgi:hypothetical protein
MAVGDSLLFTLRDELGVTDVEITATEPEVRRGRVVVSPRVEVIGQVGVGPPANLRFFRQEVGGRFEDVFTITEFPGREFTPDVDFNDQLDREEFTIGVSIAGGQERPPSSVTPGNSLSSQIVTDEPEADPIPPPEGDDQFNIVLPPLPLIENDSRILASLTIPQVSSITSAVSETVPSVGQIRGAVDDAIAGPIDRLEETLTDEIRTEVSSIDFPEFPDVPSVDQIVTAVETTVVDQVESDVQTAIDTISGEINAVIGTLEETLTDKNEDVRTNVETAIEDSTDEIDEAVTGISGALSTVGDTLGDVSDTVGSVQSDVSDILSAIPEDFETAVQTAIEGIEPTFNESGLFSDPVGFAIGFVQEASDEIVDPEVSQDLQDRAEDR